MRLQLRKALSAIMSLALAVGLAPGLAYAGGELAAASEAGFPGTLSTQAAGPDENGFLSIYKVGVETPLYSWETGFSDPRYDKATNTLTLENWTDAEASLYAINMGSDFRIRLKGSSQLSAIIVEGRDGAIAGVELAGDGSLVLNQRWRDSSAPIRISNDSKAGESRFKAGSEVGLTIYTGTYSDELVEVTRTSLADADKSIVLEGDHVDITGSFASGEIAARDEWAQGSEIDWLQEIDNCTVFKSGDDYVARTAQGDVYRLEKLVSADGSIVYMKSEWLDDDDVEGSAPIADSSDMKVVGDMRAHRISKEGDPASYFAVFTSGEDDSPRYDVYAIDHEYSVSYDGIAESLVTGRFVESVNSEGGFPAGYEAEKQHFEGGWQHAMRSTGVGQTFKQSPKGTDTASKTPPASDSPTPAAAISNEVPAPADDATTSAEQAPLAVGQSTTVGSGASGAKVRATGASEVVYTAPAKKSAKKVSVPATVKVNGKAYKVTSIAKGALKGSKATTLTIGKNVRKVAKGALKGANKLMTLVIRTSKLDKGSFANLLKGSRVKTVKLKGVSKKAKESYRKWAKAYGVTMK